MPPATVNIAIHCAPETRMAAPALLDVPVEEAVEDVSESGVAMAVVGLYVTPFASAATWKTEPPPYS